MLSSLDFKIAFLSGAFPDERIELVGALGRESISSLFEVELYLTRESDELSPAELDALLAAPCAVALGPDPGDILHGILESVRLIDGSGNLAPRYLATMVPSSWLLTQARTNRIFQEITVPEMIESILGQYGLKAGDDFEILLAGSYAPREYVVQYEETDWDFIQRWLEAEGIFYWFEHGGARDKLVMSDTNARATPIASPKAVSYRGRNNLGAAGESTIWEWALTQTRVPARVAVYDYNYRTPHLRLIAKAPVDATRGFGTVMYYNEHFKTEAEGAEVARVRAERILCGRRVFSGWTDCPRLRAGHVFQLMDHYDATHDGEYLITAVEHRVGHGILPGSAAISATEEGTVQPFKARFEAIPLGVPYRPARVTPWPTIRGALHAHVDAEDAGEYARIDEAGRYKIRLPFDSGSAGPGLASRWMRLAQPYAGAAYGSHQPLHKGAEVLVVHNDGDPDRPMLLGTVPHAHTVSPVTKPNATQSVIHTPSGLRLELEDLES